MSSGNWQEKGTRIGKVLLDAAQAGVVVRQAMRKLRMREKEEVERCLKGGPMPSQETLDALELAIRTLMMGELPGSIRVEG